MTGPLRGLTWEGWGPASLSVPGRLLGQATSAGCHGLGSPSLLDTYLVSPESAVPSLSMSGWRGVPSRVGGGCRLNLACGPGWLPRVCLPQLPLGPCCQGAGGGGLCLMLGPYQPALLPRGQRGLRSGRQRWPWSRRRQVRGQLPGLRFPLPPAGAKGQAHHRPVQLR